MYNHDTTYLFMNEDTLKKLLKEVGGVYIKGVRVYSIMGRNVMLSTALDDDQVLDADLKNTLTWSPKIYEHG